MFICYSFFYLGRATAFQLLLVKYNWYTKHEITTQNSLTSQSDVVCIKARNGEDRVVGGTRPAPEDVDCLVDGGRAGAVNPEHVGAGLRMCGPRIQQEGVCLQLGLSRYTTKRGNKPGI